jgi:hypothetical protein
MHLKEGEIRAYLDGESRQEDRPRLEEHLAKCPFCQERQQRLSIVASHAAGKLTNLAPMRYEVPTSLRISRARLLLFREEKEKIRMNTRRFARYRPALIAAGLVLIVAVSMAFAPVRAIANSFLGLFRIQQVQVVQVDPGNLPEQLGSSYQLQYFMSNDIQIQQQGETLLVSNPAEAGDLAGIPVRLPPGMNSQPRLEVTPPTQITFTVQLALFQAVLDEIGRGDISLPPEIDGALVTVDLPAIVSASYGDCYAGGSETFPQGYDPDDPTLARLPDCTTLVQMFSPQVNAPEGLDLAQLGQAYLQLLGMQPEEAARFSQNIDWASTLVIPIPVYEATFREVEVDGVDGILILGSEGDFNQQYMLIWIKADIVYMLTGPGSASTAVRLADSLR